jgi:hypothetical protein
MSEHPVAEILPWLYRSVLDAVADLESQGRRREAAAIRAEATKVYSRAWNVDAARRLRVLVARAERVREARTRTRYDAVVEVLGRRADLERKPA